MQHLVDTDDLSLDQIREIFRTARRFKEHLPPPLLEGKLLVTLFFENSTRTRSSFEIAAKRLGAQVVHLDPAKSSTKKGETLEDTFANLCAMGPDGVIIRHSENDTPSRLARMELTPVINAGAGNYAHPTQALLDLYTLYERFGGELAGRKVAIVGDIVNSRVAASDIRLFRRMGIEVHLVAPKPFMPVTDLPQHDTLEEILDQVDAVISLRAPAGAAQKADLRRLRRLCGPLLHHPRADRGASPHCHAPRPGDAQHRHRRRSAGRSPLPSPGAGPKRPFYPDGGAETSAPGLRHC